MPCLKFFETFGACVQHHDEGSAPSDTFFLEIMNQFGYVKRDLAICKTCQFSFLQGHINFQLIFF